MADPFAFTDPTALPWVGPASGLTPPQMPKPTVPTASSQPRSAVAAMLAPSAPASLAAPAQFPGAPAPTAPSAQPHASAGSVDQFMQLVRAHESGGDDKATSGIANGRYQFTPQTWAGVAREHPELGLQPQDIWDGAKQDLAMRAISKDYVNVLSMHGLAPSMPNMFMLHFLGVGGGPKFLKAMQADPNANAVQMFPLEAQYNHNDFYEKNGQPRTLQQVYAAMTKTFGGPQASMAPVDQGTLKAIDSFDAAAGVPVGARGFSPQDGEVSTSLEEMKLPPLLPGMKLAEPAKLPPLLPGMTLKLDYKSKNPLKPKGGYTDKDGVYHPPEAEKDDQIVKPGHGLTDVAGYDMAPPGLMGVVGDPQFTDPKGQQEYDKAAQEVDKGVAAGAAQDVTGPLSLLPDIYGYGGVNFEQANRYLAETGDPTARKIGNLIPMLAPVSEIFGAAKAGSKALEAGKSLWPSLARSAGVGAATGVVGASSDPTGKDEGYIERLEAKAPGMAKDFLVGGLLGGGVHLGSSAARWASDELRFLTKYFNGDAKKAAQELLNGFKTESGRTLSEDERAIAESKVKEEIERVKKEKAETELNRISKAEADLAERDRVRSQQNRDVRQAIDPKESEKLRAAVTARARERVREAENQAREAGASAAQAKEYAVEQEVKVFEAKNNAQEILSELARNPKMSKEEFGALLQKSADDLETKAEEAREKAAGFKEAIDSAPKGPIVKNYHIMNILNDMETSTADRNVHSIVNEVRKQMQTWERDSKGEWSLVDNSGISVEKADSLRKVLNAALRSREMAVENGSAVASSAQHHIGKILDALEDATGRAHPPYNAAVKAWRDNSRGPLDEFLPKNALGKVTRRQDFSGRFAMNEGRVVNEILNQSNAGSDALAVLARDNPEIVEATEKYLNRELFGIDGKNNVTPRMIEKFISKNESTLKKLDIYDKYKDMQETLETASEQIKKQETSGLIAKSAVSQAEMRKKALEDVVKERQSVLERSKSEQVGDVFSPNSTSPKVDPYAGRPSAIKEEKKTKTLTEMGEGFDERLRERFKSMNVNPSDNEKALNKVGEQLKKTLKEQDGKGVSKPIEDHDYSKPFTPSKIQTKNDPRENEKTMSKIKNSLEKMIKEREEVRTNSRVKNDSTANKEVNRKLFSRPEDAAKIASDKARSDAARLKKSREEPENARREAEKNLSEVTSGRIKAETSKKAYTDFQTRIANAEKEGTLSNDRVISETDSLLKTLRSRDVIDDNKYNELNAKIEKAIKSEKDRKEARALVLKITAILASGLIGGDYIAHRVYLK